MDVILEMRGTKSEHAPTELDEDTVLEALFKVRAEIHPAPRIHGKRHY